MIALIVSEWQRVCWFALGACGLNLALLAVLSNYGLLFSNNLGLNVALTTTYGCVATLFGVHQIRTYAAEGRWLCLVNRPLSPGMIFLSLACAASLFFLLAVVGPWMVVTLGFRVFSISVIEFRHFLTLPYLFGITTSFYLAGVLMATSRSPLMAVVLWLPLLCVVSLHVGGNVLLLTAIVTGVMFVLATFFFKPSMAARLNAPIQIGLAALSIQLCCFQGITAISETTLQIIDQNFASPEDSSAKPEQPSSLVAKSYRQTVQLDGHQKILSGLSGWNEGRSKHVARSVTAGEVHAIKKAVSFLPTRHQLPLVYDRGLQIVDDEREIVWEFSHRAMQFVGHSKNTKARIGWIGPENSIASDGDARRAGQFSAVPWISGRQIVCGNKLFRFDKINQRVELLVELNDGQTILSPLMPRGSLCSLVSDRELILFDGILVSKDEFPVHPITQIALPDDYNNLRDISLVELRDEYLVSFLFGKDERVRAYDAAQYTYRVDRNGRTTFLHDRLLERETPATLVYLSSLISPLGELVVDRFPILPSRDRYLEQRASVFRWPSSICVLLLIIAAINISFTGWLSKRRGLGSRETWIWMLTNGMMGVPGIVSFLALTKTTPNNLCFDTTCNADQVGGANGGAN